MESVCNLQIKCCINQVKGLYGNNGITPIGIWNTNKNACQLASMKSTFHTLPRSDTTLYSVVPSSHGPTWYQLIPVWNHKTRPPSLSHNTLKGPHYGVPIVRICEKIHHVTKALHCYQMMGTMWFFLSVAKTGHKTGSGNKTI